MAVALGRKVKVAYTGYLEDGTVFDNTHESDTRPLEYLVGRRQVIPGFDKAVSEMCVGQRRTVRIPANMAYGLYSKDLVQEVACENFPKWEELPVGSYVTLNASGEAARAKVLSVENDTIRFDFNHELAGKNLVFDLKLLDVYGEGGSLVEQEHESGCSCGCHVLKEAIDPRSQQATQ